MIAPSVSQNKVNDNWLGTCRGIAALCVILSHILGYFTLYFHAESFLIDAVTVNIVNSGQVGVALLFLISGYLAPSGKRKRTVRRFAANRFFRLYPLYWLDILLVGVFFAFDGYGPDTVLANVTMLQVFMRKEDLVGLFWTLPIELMLYAVCVIAEGWLWNPKKLLKTEILFALCAIGGGYIRKTVWASAPVAIGLLLSIGLLGQLCRLYQDGLAQKESVMKGICVFEATLVITSYLAYQVDMGHQERWYRYVLSYSLALFIFLAFMRAHRSVKAFTLLAAISYPIYLEHEIVFRVAFGRIWHEGLNPAVFVVLTLLALVGVSVAAHIAIELPMLKVGNRIEARLK